uniref:protein OS-9-like n=1 Tax=Oncorhynchus gorbuscha TaxID=8017 RepID=UPI001EAF55E1|nr:protein OS-9-like [Oncorhynchus gorbuscha]
MSFPETVSESLCRSSLVEQTHSLISCPGGWSQTIQQMKKPGVDVLGWSDYTWSAVVRPTKDLWTCEFCYGQHIRQYHLEDTGVKGDVFFPGYYDSEFDWINETAKASKQHRLKRYHSQSYVNGSKCDLNGSPRETEVRFVCEKWSGDYVARVDEPQSCRYVLTFHTTRTCLHPFLCPPSTAKPQGIVCQPALSTQQYMDYVKAQVSDTKRKVEQISEELKTLDEILTGDEGTDGTADERTDEESATPTEVPDVLGSDTEAFGDETFNSKVITDPADLMKCVQHLKESNRKKAQNEAEREALRKKKERRGAEDEDGEERLLWHEFDEEIAGLLPFSVYFTAQQELDTEGLKGEFDRTQATQTLETSLDKLLNRLEDKDAGDTEAEHLTEGGQKANDPARGPPNSQVTELSTKGSTHWAWVYVHFYNRSPLHPASLRILVGRGPLFVSRLVTPNQATDDHVQIRVTKYKTSSSPDGEVEVQEMGEGDLQWQHIKDMVKGQLEKAGLKAEGKIEVKI